MKDRITLKEFFDSKEKVAIYCKTEDQADNLCIAFNSLGKTWLDGTSYALENCFNCVDEICYCNDGMWCDKSSLKDNNWKIYEYKDIIFENKHMITLEEYLNEKQSEVLKVIKPICEAFGIKNYDYIINAELYSEILKLDNTYIGCRGNSIDAIINELLGYIIIERNIDLGTFENQTIKYLKRHWEKDNERL